MTITRIILEICTNFSLLFSSLSFILTFVYYKKLNAEFKFFSLFLLLGLSTEIFSLIYIAFLNNESNLFVIPLYYNLEFLIMSFLFVKYFFRKTNWIALSVIALIQFVLIIEGYRSIIDAEASSFHAYGKVLVNFTIVVYCLRFFLELAYGSINKQASKVALNILIFVYYVLSLIIFIFINFLINGDSTFTIYFWIFNSMISLVFYYLISRLIWKIGTARKLSLFGYQSF